MKKGGIRVMFQITIWEVLCLNLDQDGDYFEDVYVFLNLSCRKPAYIFKENTPDPSKSLSTNHSSRLIPPYLTLRETSSLSDKKNHVLVFEGISLATFEHYHEMQVTINLRLHRGTIFRICHHVSKKWVVGRNSER